MEVSHGTTQPVSGGSWRNNLSPAQNVVGGYPDGGLTNLNALGLSYTKITDAGLVHLKGLTKLETLDLFNTKITDAGVKSLKEALPDCRISR